MESCVMAAVFLNNDNLEKMEIQNIDSISILKEIKLLLLSPTRRIPSFQLPMISMLTKQNKAEEIRDGIRKILRIKSKNLKMMEVFLSQDKGAHKIKSRLMIVFLNSTQSEKHITSSDLKSEFVPLNDLKKIPIGDQSMDYIMAFNKWIKTESINPGSLLKWFRPERKGNLQIFKLKRSTIEMSSEMLTNKYVTDIRAKSTSLDTIASPRINHDNPPRKQADSLDRITKTEKLPSPLLTKNEFKSKITQPKILSNSGPISAVPMLEKYSENVVFKNPLLNNNSDFFWHSEIVIKNPFWNQQKPDISQIRNNSKSLFYKEKYVKRNRSWPNDYPLHSATYRGDIHLVSPLIDKGYTCIQRDNAGWTPFHYAVWYGHKEIVSLFLQHQLVSVNGCTEDLLTPIHLSLLSRQSTITRLLLKEPDIDISLKNSAGEEICTFAEKYDKQFMLPLTKFIPPKLSRVSVSLMNNTVKSLVLTLGMETTFQQLRLQMLEILNIPASCLDVFSFWIGYRIPKFTGKNSVIPVECLVPYSKPLKSLPLSDFKLYWKRNIFLGLATERKLKNPVVLSLLFEEAVFNFTLKSYYPCDTKDISLLSSVLLYLHLPLSNQQSKNIQDRRAFSLNRVNRPLSFVLGSKLNVQSRQMSASMQTLKDRPRYHYTSSSFNDLSENSPAQDQRIREAKIFLSSNKNVALILPKKKLKYSKINWVEEINKRFLQSSYSSKSHSIQERQYRFLTLCWNLTLYGCAYFHVEIKLNSSIPFTDCILAINDMGIYFLHSGTKNLIQNFKYSSITWHPSESDKCLVLFTRKNNIYVKTKQSIIISQLMLRLHSINL